MKEYKRKDAVTIRIYDAIYHKFTVGHVTLETYGENPIFVDLRPKGHEEKKAVSLGVIKKRGISSQPNVEINLYGLDVNAIENIWRNIRDRCKWHLISTKVNIDENTSYSFNSASLCLSLLFFGNIHKAYPDVINNLPGDVKKFLNILVSLFKTLIPLTVTTTLTTAFIAELLVKVTVQQKIDATISLLPAVVASFEVNFFHLNKLAQQTTELITITPGQVSDLIIDCRKCHDNQSNPIKINKNNKLSEIIPPTSKESCVLL